MAVTTTKTNPTNNNLSTTLLLPYIIAISLILTQLTYQNIKNQATYNSTGAGVSYNTKDKTSFNSSLPQNIKKSQNTKATIDNNIKVTINNKDKQTQDITKINHNTKDASYTLTKIDTKALQIREDLANKTAKAGFEKVGDYAMEQASRGDKAWEDGGVKKTVAHLVVGATVAAIGNGDALSGALGAGARELASKATKDKDKTTQQVVSTLIGGAVSGGTGASVALKGEKFNRQLHQKEIKWIKKHSLEFAKELYGENPTPQQIQDAQSKLTEQALRQVDKGWSLKLGDKDNKNAKSFLERNNAHLFEVKSDAEYYNPTITRYGDTITKIKDLNQRDKEELKNFYTNNVKNASNTPLKELYIQDLKKRGIKNAKELWEGLKGSPKAIYEYIKKTPIKQIGEDTLEVGKSIAKGVKDTATEGMDASTASGEIARNKDGTADLLNELYNDKTAATAGRLMVDEDLFEAVTLVGGAAKGAATGVAKIGKASIKGIKKLPNGNVKLELEGGKSVVVDESVAKDYTFIIGVHQGENKNIKIPYTNKILFTKEDPIGHAFVGLKDKDGDLVFVQGHYPNNSVEKYGPIINNIIGKESGTIGSYMDFFVGKKGKIYDDSNYYSVPSSIIKEFPVTEQAKDNLLNYVEQRGKEPFYSIFGHKQCASYAIDCANSAGVDLGISGYKTPKKIKKALEER